jgi:DNA-binding transcriptional LysR family regulator
MNWQQLEYFKAVAETENFTSAANLLSVTQPAISKAISKLEEELNVPLFEKSGRNIKVTKYGVMFLDHVNIAMAEIKEGIQKIQASFNPSTGTVSVASNYSTGAQFMPYLISDFLKLAPNTKFQFSQESALAILQSLKSGKIDLGFYDNFQVLDVSEEIESHPIRTDDLVLIVPKNHRLANHNEVFLRDLTKEKFVVVCEGIKNVMHDKFKNAGFVPSISLVQNEHSMINGFVAAGLGIAIVPNTSGINKNELSILKINDLSCQRTIMMGWMKNRYMTPVATAFKDFVLESVNKTKEHYLKLA